jgi:hypothetical protein
MSKQRIIEVVADWVGLERPTLIGHLSATPARGKELFVFEYAKECRCGPQAERLRDGQLPGPRSALSVASVFRVEKNRAVEIGAEVTRAVNQWRAVATSHGLARAAQDRMRRAFRVAEAWASG